MSPSIATPTFIPIITTSPLPHHHSPLKTTPELTLTSSLPPTELSEEWATLREPVVEGVTFYCKYLGSTLVDDPKGEAATAEAIKRIIHTAKQVARKPERVALHVSLKGIRMEDSVTKEMLLQTSIYK